MIKLMIVIYYKGNYGTVWNYNNNDMVLRDCSYGQSSILQ